MLGCWSGPRGSLDSEREIRRVEILCRLWIRLETNPKVKSDWITNLQRNSDQVMFGERLDDHQEWCVGGRPAVVPAKSSRP